MNQIGNLAFIKITHSCISENVSNLLFRSSNFSFLVFGQFWRRSYTSTKILCNLCLHFARQDGQAARRKKRKENHATKVTKIPTRRQKYGMNETLSLFSNMFLFYSNKNVL